MAYYIKQIPNNTYNKYKYNYLDHIETIIDMKDNYWSFAMQAIMINNSSLPLNTLTLDMQLPYQSIDNVIFNLAVDQTHAKDKVKANPAYAKAYDARFNVDVSQNQYLKQSLNNAKLNIGLSFQIDPEVIAKASFGPTQDDLDGLINETGEQRFDFCLYYTNTYQINKSKEVFNNYGYTLQPFQHECVANGLIMNFDSNDYLANKQAIKQLAIIKSTSEFQILFAKVKFNYWINDESDVKTLETDLDVSTQYQKEIIVEFDKHTNFDFTNNKVVIDPFGINGFYIPKLSHGDYELTLKINQNGIINNFIIKNSFVFDILDIKPYIGCCQILINSLKEFKEIRF